MEIAFEKQGIKKPAPFDISKDYELLKSSAGGGTRTHTPLRITDFESVSSANSDTPAYFCICCLRMISYHILFNNATIFLLELLIYEQLNWGQLIYEQLERLNCKRLNYELFICKSECLIKAAFS